VRVIKPLPASRYAACPGDGPDTIAARDGTIAAPAARLGAGAFLGVFSLAFLVPGTPAANAQAAPAATALTSVSAAIAARVGPDQLRVVFRAAVSVPAEYVVRPGDTLSAISGHLFGNPDKWPWLYDYNRKIIGDNPDMITPGEKLSATLGARPEYGDAVAAVARAQRVVADYQARTASATSAHDGYASVPNSGGWPGGSFGKCVVARESGGNAQVMNSSDHYGLYQFSASTWAAYGGNPAAFGDASVAEQEAVFDNAMAQGGESNWSSYDGC
jgi:hypothetical protein